MTRLVIEVDADLAADLGFWASERASLDARLAAGPVTGDRDLFDRLNGSDIRAGLLLVRLLSARVTP